MPHEQSPDHLRAIHEEIDKPADLMFGGLYGLDIVAEAQTALNNTEPPISRIERAWRVMESLAELPIQGSEKAGKSEQERADDQKQPYNALAAMGVDKLQAMEALHKVLTWGLTEGGSLAYPNSHFKVFAENGNLYHVHSWKHKRARIHKIDCYQDELIDDCLWSANPEAMEPDRTYTLIKKRKDLRIVLKDKQNDDTELLPIDILNLAGHIRVGLEAED